jgi:hypothetical protein
MYHRRAVLRDRHGTIAIGIVVRGAMAAAAAVPGAIAVTVLRGGDKTAH